MSEPTSGRTTAPLVGLVAAVPGVFPRRPCPVTVGVPFARGVCRNPELLAARLLDGSLTPLQTRVLDRWGDDTIRWLLCDAQVQAQSGGPVLDLVWGTSGPRHASPLDIHAGRRHVTVETGTSTFEFRAADAVLAVVRTATAEEVPVRLELRDAEGRRQPARIDHIQIEERGDLRSVVRLDGTVGTGAVSLQVILRVHVFAGLSAARFDVTLRNPHRALHDGGHWDLGDPGSIDIGRWSLLAGECGSAEGGPVTLSLDADDEPRTMSAPVELRQASSGGVRWDSRNHVNRHGAVALPYRGYHLTTGSESASGLRASPILVSGDGASRLALYIEDFWQNFPIGCASNGRGVEARLFDDSASEPLELQGGEQKTHTVWIAVGEDPATPMPLAWARKPTALHLTPEAYRDADAFPYLTPEAQDDRGEHVALIRAAIEGDDTFDRKREIIDEYGWRHFGEIYGDHEAVRHDGPSPLVSHYNNQYDAVLGFAVQFMRTGDLSWRRHMRELAVHVVDIDIYHTDEDKAAYNRGLFWHTIHYIDADTATHRTYPASCGHGGGPSSEHNYPTGLMYAWFLTGDARYRDAALDLAHFPIRIDDGALTPFRWLARGDTGLASASASLAYQGPGRGSGNSLNALLDGYRLTRDRVYLDKAEQIVRRVAHPDDDVERHSLLDAERRWFYTMFLQSLGRYLDDKAERGEIDWMYGYAQASLLRYARWMADYEHPYLDTPDRLEFPTETWAAQDIRKADVFNFARKHASTSDERERFAERARFFFDYSVAALSRSPTRSLARPVVILLTSGQSHGWFEAHPNETAPPGPAVDPPRERVAFEPQRIRAMRRARGLAGTAAVASVVGLGWVLLALLPRFGFF